MDRGPGEPAALLGDHARKLLLPRRARERRILFVESLARCREYREKVGEQFIRGLHLKQMGTPAPPEYDNAQPSELLELFRRIPGTLPDEHGQRKVLRSSPRPTWISC